MITMINGKAFWVNGNLSVRNGEILTIASAFGDRSYRIKTSNFSVESESPKDNSLRITQQHNGIEKTYVVDKDAKWEVY